MIISKLILAKFSLTSHLSYNRQNFGISPNNCLCIMVLISICHCLVRVCARACVWGWACVSVFVCMFYMPCVEWVWMFFVLLFYVIYSRTIDSIANVFCWLYPTLNKVYLILWYFWYSRPVLELCILVDRLPIPVEHSQSNGWFYCIRFLEPVICNSKLLSRIFCLLDKFKIGPVSIKRQFFPDTWIAIIKSNNVILMASLILLRRHLYIEPVQVFFILF